MFSKILIANRGEIACRIIRTARRMGIASVAVYSEADARAPFVQMADEAIAIGASPASESYLVQEKIISACLASGAQAVHPGYGFLSERASFVDALAAENIAFIGPPAAAIAAMGDKIESKKLARDAGVNIVPGYVGEIADSKHAVEIADEIGYPIMMKASAGGGGKGMRLAYSAAEVREGFDSVRREGLNSFGDDRIFIEKFIENPRHIEIQILGDQHGNLLYLNERECSIQRRHQKVIEEAPSPFVTAAMRAAMGEQSLALARAVDYYSAGTVELIVSGADLTGESFYFLEMNTRLQVEHPVTEAVTGIDLVEQMIRIAAGEKLALTQADIALDGWAIESRIYAEDPYRGYLPSTGRLVRYRSAVAGQAMQGAPPAPSEPPTEPTEPLEPRTQADSSASGDLLAQLRGASGVRVDDGVAEGSEVSIFYDPMIAKLISWGETRDIAADRQVAALDRTEIAGLRHNIDLLAAIVQNSRFRAGALTTGFLAEEYPDGFHGSPTSAADRQRLAAVAAYLSFVEAAHALTISGQLGGDSLGAPVSWEVRLGEAEDSYVVAIESVEVAGESVATVRLLVDGEVRELSISYRAGARRVEVFDGVFDAAAGAVGEGQMIQLERGYLGWRMTTGGAVHVVQCLPSHIAGFAEYMLTKAPPDLSRFLLCPMPGVLVALHVAEGDAVEIGQPLATVEAMKMENILRAEKAGIVSSLCAAAGDSLAVDAVILEIE